MSERHHGLRVAALIQLYRYTLSPLIGFHCRHLPTCSEYGDEALQRHGLWAGGWMTLGPIVPLPPATEPPGSILFRRNRPRRRAGILPWRYARWRSTNETPPATGT